MALTDVQIINGGLSKIASSRIRQIAPAISPLEQYMAVNYPQWRDELIEQHRWVFAWEMRYQLTLSQTLPTGNKPYKYSLPPDCARPVRAKRDEWVQRGRYIYSAYSSLCIDYIRNVSEADYDALFRGALMCKIAFESAEFVTQSNTKKQTAAQAFDDAIDKAKQANAFIIGKEETEDVDEEFSWIDARHNPQIQR